MIDRQISKLEVNTAIEVIQKISKTFKNYKISQITSVSILYRLIAYYHLSNNEYIHAIKYLIWSDRLGDDESTFVITQLDIIMNSFNAMNSLEAKKLFTKYINMKEMCPDVPNVTDVSVAIDCEIFDDFDDLDFEEVIFTVEKMVLNNFMLNKKIINPTWITVK